MVFAVFPGHSPRWPWTLTFWPKNLVTILSSLTQIHRWPKSGEIFLIFEMRCSEGFQDTQTRSLTHSRTDRPEYRIPPTPFSNDGEGIKLVDDDDIA